MSLMGVFATRFNPKTNKKFSKEIIDEIQDQLGEKFLNSFIRENITLSESQAEGKHIFDYSQDCNGARDYHALASQVLERMG